MSGQIIERGKKFLCRVFVGRNELGKREYLNHTVHSKDEAKKWIRKTLVERDRGELVVGKTTISTLLDDLLTSYENNGKKSLPWARIVVNHLRPVFGKIRPSKLTTDHLQRYITLRK